MAFLKDLKPSCPILWSREELDELAGTCVEEQLDLENMEVDYRRNVLPFIQQHPSLFSSELSSHTAFLRASAVIMTRAFDHPECGPCMAPIVDLFNTNVRHNAAMLHFYDDAFVVRTIAAVPLPSASTSDTTASASAATPLPQQQELYLSYGAHLSNEELLKRYGFVDEDNPFDSVPLAVSFVADTIGEACGELLDDQYTFLDELEFAYFYLRPNGRVPKSLLQVMKVLLSEEGLKQHLAEQSKLEAAAAAATTTTTTIDLTTDSPTTTTTSTTLTAPATTAAASPRAPDFDHNNPEEETVPLSALDAECLQILFMSLCHRMAEFATSVNDDTAWLAAHGPALKEEEGKGTHASEEAKMAHYRKWAAVFLRNKEHVILVAVVQQVNQLLKGHLDSEQLSAAAVRALAAKRTFSLATADDDEEDGGERRGGGGGAEEGDDAGSICSDELDSAIEAMEAAVQKNKRHRST